MNDKRDQLGSPKEEIDRLRDLIWKIGYCPDCKEEYTMPKDEPFAFCGCGISECYTEGVIQQLRRKIHDLETINS